MAAMNELSSPKVICVKSTNETICRYDPESPYRLRSPSPVPLAAKSKQWISGIPREEEKSRRPSRRRSRVNENTSSVPVSNQNNVSINMLSKISFLASNYA